MKLNNATLPEIPIAKPTYDRDEISVGIVHFGVGGFHRAHQAMYVDRLLELGQAKEWGICGVGVLPGDRKMATVMADQDGLYTLVAMNPDGTRDAAGHRLDRRLPLRARRSRGRHRADRRAEHPDRVADHHRGRLRHRPRPADGVSVFGLVTDALARRRDRGLPSPTIVSCDNIEGNGDVARQAFTAYAANDASRAWPSG